MENKGFVTVLGVLVALGLFGVYVYQEPEDIRENPAQIPERMFRQATGIERRADYESDRQQAEAIDTVDGYGVSASHPLAVDAGMEVLAEGGNAVDAAVATAYALGVVEPFGSGVGGGGAMLVHQPGEDPVAYEYREVVAADGEIPFLNTGIPGFVRGMEVVNDEHGTMDMAELIQPSIDYAADGVEVSSLLQDRLQAAAHRMPIDDLPLFYPNGRPIQAGDELVQEEQAATLRAIAEGGADEFYEGALAEELSAAVEGIDMESLAAYEVQQSTPAIGQFAGYDIISGPPPTPGTSLVQTLQVAEELGVGEHEPGSADFIHALAMSWRIGNHFRIEEVADPEFVDVPVDELTDPENSRRLAGEVSMDEVLAMEEDEPLGGLETDTTHITVVDAEGTMVSVTNTLSNFFGAGLHRLGFFLNDQLKNFASDEDSVNSAEPGKRPRTFITPTIVAEDGRPVIGLGSPSGRRIPIVLAQVLARWAAHGEPFADAVAAPRFHREGDSIEFEEQPSSDMIDELLDRGYTELDLIGIPYYFGAIQALVVDYEADELYGIADGRRTGDWRVDDAP